MAQTEWKPDEMRQLADDLRLLANGIDCTEDSHLKRLADELNVQADQMEGSGWTRQQIMRFSRGLGVRC
jgi:uncharacterized protein YukE